MTPLARKILRTLKGLLLGLFIVFGIYLLIITAFVIWAFEVKLQRWPLFVHAAPFELHVDDNIKQVNLMRRLNRLGYRQTADPVPRPGYWNRAGTKLNLALKHSSLQGQGIVSGPVEISLDWNRIRSIRLMRAKETVERIYIEPELLTLILGRGMEPELCRGVPLKEISPTLLRAVILTEDTRFFSHHGIDLISIRHAVEANIKAGRYVEGASTIPQQLIKMTLLTPEKTLVRKINEAFLAIVADALYDKETILEAYLNRVYLGHWGAFPVKGIAEASRVFFGKDQRDLDAAECALMAAIIRAPNVISPRFNPDRARKRRNVILRLLLKDGAISREQYDLAASSPVKMATFGASPVKARPFLEWVRTRVDEQVGRFKPGMGSQDLLTSLDPIIQDEALRLLRPLGPAASEAHLVVANPSSGAVRAYVAPPEDNWDGRGDTLEPLLAIAVIPALIPEKSEQVRFTAASQIFFPERKQEPYTFRQAFHEQPAYLARHLLETVGSDKIVSALREFGISAESDTHRKIALQPYTPREAASIYCLFATLGDSGVLAPAFRIVSKFPVESASLRRRVQTDRRILFLVNHMMKELETVALTGDRGPGGRSNTARYTVEDDAGLWSVAYRGDRLLLARIPGKTINRQALRRMIDRLVPDPGHNPAKPVVPPSGIVFRKTCVQSGLRATSLCPTVVQEAFLKGTQPVEWCPLSHETGPDAPRTR